MKAEFSIQNSAIRIKMTAFDDLFAEMGLPLLKEQLGETVTYTPAGGENVELTAIVGPEETEETEDLEGITQRRVRQVTIATDPDGDWGGVAAPGTNDSLTIGGVEYAVEAIEAQSASLTQMRLVRRGVAEKARMGYRK